MSDFSEKDVSAGSRGAELIRQLAETRTLSDAQLKTLLCAGDLDAPLFQAADENLRGRRLYPRPD